MVVARTVKEVREFLESRKNIGLVPTMGALHAGHEALIKTVRAQCDVVTVSVFVNPLQFGPTEDYSRYPRTWPQDLDICDRNGVDLVFAPPVEEIYPTTQLITVNVGRLDEHLCGKSRPGHFRGVATVVLKLLNIARPDRAYFGEKDLQQLAIVRRMVADLNIPVTIVGVPTVRAPDGLALAIHARHFTLEPRASSRASGDRNEVVGATPAGSRSCRW